MCVEVKAKALGTELIRPISDALCHASQLIQTCTDEQKQPSININQNHNHGHQLGRSATGIRFGKRWKPARRCAARHALKEGGSSRSSNWRSCWCVLVTLGAAPQR